MSDETILGKFGIGHRMSLLAYWLIVGLLLPIFYCINTQINYTQLNLTLKREVEEKQTEKFQSIHLFRKLFIMNVEFKFPMQLLQM